MESLLGEVGAGGRFQVQLVASVKFADMSLAWGMMQMTFAGLVPDWWCQPPEAANSSHGNWSRDNTTFHICPVSNNSDTCGEVVFDDSVQTIVNEWTLVCDLDYVKPMVTSLQMGGVLFGALLGGQVSDSLGRRPTAYLAYLANLIVSLVTAFSISWRMFAIMRVLIGVTLGRISGKCAMAGCQGASAGGRSSDQSSGTGQREAETKDTLERLQEVMEEELKAGQGRRYTYIDVYRGWRMAVTSLAINFIW
ncbi:hypothetical protein C0Q70_04134 [Pomacea canaliculata]|uniref:Major facilitator superfamily (MFS) profile domain-containing protein n=1 Tax=Pomacea canaliculata TaxID=400727 RepID=A0A2T7PUQ1_POMCA|nr:hypothetical protein C0Q70_04134 [Pomacea canaliculata]